MTTLDELYAELDRVERMTVAEVMTAYNADSKEEIIELIREDIDILERKCRTCPDDELEQERMQTCLSQGLSRYC